MSNFLWVEKYRPKTIDECILPENIKDVLNKFVENYLIYYYQVLLELERPLLLKQCVNRLVQTIM